MRFAFRILLLFFFAIAPPPLALAQEFSISESKTMKEGEVDYIRQIKFSPFGNYIAVSHGNNTTELFDKNWNLIYTSQGDSKAFPSQCTFSPDERLLIFSKYRNKSDVAIYNITESRVVQTLQDHEDMIYTLALSSDGKFLCTGGADESFIVYAWEQNQFKLTKKEPLKGTKPYSLFFSTDGRELIAGLYNGKTLVYAYSHASWELTQTLEGDHWSVDEVVCSPDGRRLAISTNNYTIDIYEKAGGAYKKVQTIKGLDRTAESLCYSPDSRFLAAGMTNGCIEVWQNTAADTLKELRKMYRYDNRVLHIDFSPDGKTMSTSAYERPGILWSLEGVKPSYKSMIGNIMGSDMTFSQKNILSGSIPFKIISAIDASLLLPKDEFETNMDFLKRREKLKSQLTALLQEHMEEFYQLDKKGNTLETVLDKVVSYDADGQQYFLLFMRTPGKIKIPANEAKALKENWGKAKVTVVKSKDKNGDNTYKKFTLVHPTNGKSYDIEVTENPFIPGSTNAESRSSTSSADLIQLAKADTASKEKSYGGTKYALIFATNDYDNYHDLINPMFDAKTIAEELTRNYGYQSHLVENATLDEILRMLKRYAQLSYDKEDQLFIFFAGHGKYDEIFREGYLVAKESKLQDDARTTFLSHSNLRTIVNNIPCDHIFLTMDVCFGGTFDPYLAAHRGDEQYEEVAKTEYIERKMKYKTRLYLTSGGKEYVPDGRPGEHSPFARKFLEALRSYGGKDGILTIGEIITYVEKVVPQPRTGEFGNNEPGSDFVFVAK
jgi:hypothetical protein